jgi:hypothetical protein
MVIFHSYVSLPEAIGFSWNFMILLVILHLPKRRILLIKEKGVD